MNKFAFKLFLIFAFIIKLNCNGNINSIIESFNETDLLPNIPTYSIEVDYNCNYWSIPSRDSFILFFELYKTIKVDSLIAGAIQFRLDRAKSVDIKLNDFQPSSRWELGALLLGTNNELYNLFDESTNRFGYKPLDYLLNEFKLIRGEKSRHSDMIKLYFQDDYNMSVIGNIFETVLGVRYADPNCYGTIPESSSSGVVLEIDNELFNFNFYQSDFYANNIHQWDIQVIDDIVTLISEWDESIY